MLVSMKELLDHARLRGYCVAAPNAFNDATVAMCVEAAEICSSPLIIDFAEGHGDISAFASIALFYINRSKMPIALNLDHGNTFEGIMEAIRSGFSAVMIDRSTCPFEKNVEDVAEIVHIAHSVGVSVEAELGHVGAADPEKMAHVGLKAHVVTEVELTNPTEARIFVERTGVDCLAIAVGNAHGKYVSVPSIDFERLARIGQEVSIPLVLHGGSGIEETILKRAIDLGVSKVNIGTDLFNAYCDAFSQESKMGLDAYVLTNSINAGKVAYRDKLIEYIHLLGSANMS
jgi:fructose-bisphosphate aldolase class II